MRRVLLKQIQNGVSQLSYHASKQPRLSLFKDLAGQGVHTLPFKFSTEPVKNLTSILAFKFLNG